MAQAPRIVAVDFDRGKVYPNSTVEAAYTWKSFYSGDTERFRVYLVKANPSAGAGRLTTISATGLTLKVALGVRAAGAAGTVYTSVTLTASSDGNYFEGDLPLNVSGVTNLFSSSAADQSARIEFELDDSGYKQTHSEGVTIVQQIIGTSLIDTPAPDVAMGTLQARGEFVPQVDAETFIMKDQDGTGRRYQISIHGGTLRVDPIGT